jgi:hypothetical protein
MCVILLYNIHQMLVFKKEKMRWEKTCRMSLCHPYSLSVIINQLGLAEHFLPLWKMMEFVSWDDDIPNIWENKVMFQTTNQFLNSIPNISHICRTNPHLRRIKPIKPCWSPFWIILDVSTHHISSCFGIIDYTLWWTNSLLWKIPTSNG